MLCYCIDKFINLKFFIDHSIHFYSINLINLKKIKKSNILLLFHSISHSFIVSFHVLINIIRCLVLSNINDHVTSDQISGYTHEHMHVQPDHDY